MLLRSCATGIATGTDCGAVRQRPIGPHLASWHPRIYTDPRSKHSPFIKRWRHTRRMIESWRTYSPWVTAPPWNNRRPPEPSTTPTLQQMFALAQDSRRAIDHSLIRTGDSVLRHGPVGTTRGSSALAADNSDICRPAVHSRTLHYHLSQWVGTFSYRSLLTHTGLYALHSTPTSSSHTKSSSPSSPPDTAITSNYQQSTSCTETCT